MRVAPLALSPRPHQAVRVSPEQQRELFLPPRVDLPPEPAAPVKPWKFPDEPILLVVGGVVGLGLGVAAGISSGVLGGALGGLVGLSWALPLAGLASSKLAGVDYDLDFLAHSWTTPVSLALCLSAGVAAGAFTDSGVLLGMVGGAGGMVGPIMSWVAYDQFSGQSERYDRELAEYRQARGEYEQATSGLEIRREAESVYDIPEWELELSSDYFVVGEQSLPRQD